MSSLENDARGNGKGSNANDLDEGILPFDPAMERISMFVPRYLSRLMAMVAMKEDSVKAKVIRNAILRELRKYADKAKTHNGGPYAKIAEDGLPTQVAADAEGDEDFVRQLYRDFALIDDKFPTRVRLRQVGEAGIAAG